MAAHYRGAIADVLQDFDNSQHSRQFYLDLAWEGLKNAGVAIPADKETLIKNEESKIILNVEY